MIFMVMVWGLSESVHLNYLEQCLAHNKLLKNINIIMILICCYENKVWIENKNVALILCNNKSNAMVQNVALPCLIVIQAVMFTDISFRIN